MKTLIINKWQDLDGEVNEDGLKISYVPDDFKITKHLMIYPPHSYNTTAIWLNELSKEKIIKKLLTFGFDVKFQIKKIKRFEWFKKYGELADFLSLIERFACYDNQRSSVCTTSCYECAIERLIELVDDKA